MAVPNKQTKAQFGNQLKLFLKRSKVKKHDEKRPNEQFLHTKKNCAAQVQPEKKCAAQMQTRRKCAAQEQTEKKCSAQVQTHFQKKSVSTAV